MAEQITLSAYIERIENMIRQGRMDEAIAHSAHVLQFFPKNAVVYRNLGRALMRQQRYDEAGEVFRRLLAAIPDDFSAHYQLSVVYEQENRADEALWHVERAFDQQPGNSQVNDRLRALYKKFRQVEVEKIQLTAGSVANQYLKANMFDEALETLNRALDKVPDRVDLRLTKARLFWKQGEVVDAAETALDILNTYPYAIDANRILAELWLQEDRPTDAQRFLVRVEDIDPFLAYQIVADEAPADERFMLDELDFTRYAASLASKEQAPDWLSNIEELAESEDIATADDFVADAPLDDFDDADIPEAEMVEDNSWLDEIDDDSQPLQPVVTKVTEDLSDLLPDNFSFPDSAGTDDTVDDDLSDLLFGSDDNNDSVSDLFADLDDNDDDEGTGLTGLLGEDDYDSPSAEMSGLTGLLGMLEGKESEIDEALDDMSWLDDVSSGDYDADKSYDTNDLPDTETSDDFLQELEQDDDPLAWLGGDEAAIEDDEPVQSVDPNDPLAWLQSDGIEFEEDSQDSYAEALAVEDDEPTTLESSDVDPLAWLGGDDLEIQAQDTGHLVTNDFNDDAEEAVDDDPLSWLADEGVEFESTGEFEAVDTGDISPESENDSMAWLNEAGIDLSDDDNIISGQVLTDHLTHLDEDESDLDGDPMEWLEDDGVEFLDTGEAVDDDNWLSDDSVLDDLLNIADLTNTTGAEPVNDYLIDTEMQDTMTDEPEFSPDDNFDWLANDDDDTASDDSGLDADNDDSMAWLNDDGLEISDDNDFALEADNDDDSMAWLNEDSLEISDDNDDSALEADSDDSMNWLDDSADAVADELDFTQDEPEEAPVSGTSMLNFLSDSHDEELPEIGEISEEDAFGEEETDWLRALDGDEPLATEAESFSDDFGSSDDADATNIDWGTSDDDDTSDDGLDWDFDEDEGEEALDWTIEPESEDDDAQPADADWLSDLGDEQAEDDTFADFAEDDAQPADADWLSDLGDEQAEDDTFADFAEDDDVQPADADWLSDLGDEQAGDDTFADFAEDDDAQPAEADWLSDLGDEQAEDDTFADFAEDDDAQPADADWLADLGDEQAEDDFAEDDAQPADADWLADLGDEQAEDDTFADFAEDDDAQPAEADWLSDLGDEQAEDDTFADFAEDDDAQPAEADWLSDLDEFDEEQEKLEEAEPVAEEGGGWLDDIGVQEENEWDDEDYQEEHEDYDLNVSTKGMSEMLDSIRTSRDDEFETTLDDIDIDEPEWIKQTGEVTQFDDNNDDEWIAELDDTTIGDDEDDSHFDDDFQAEAVDDTADENESVVDDFAAQAFDEDVYEEEFDDYANEEAIPLAEIEEEEEEEIFQASNVADNDYKEDTIQEDADNAPDWLNAMVPGLDLDFEAEDEGHLDEGFEERESTLRERRINESEIINSDIEWLHDIVEEESGMMEVIEDDHSASSAPPITMPQRRVFEFSTLPVWARGDTVQNIVQSGEDDALPDYLSDFDNFEEAQDYDLNVEFDDNFEFETDEVAVQDSNFEFEDSHIETPDDSFNFDSGGIEIGDDLDDEFDGDFNFDDEFDDDFDDDFDD